MALPVAPQRLALRDLQDLMEENRRNHRILLLAILARRRRERQRQNQRMDRRWWVKPWSSVERRIEFGPYHNLLEELDQTCQEDYRGYVRMDRNMFGELLQRIAPRITKSDRYVQLLF